MSGPPGSSRPSRRSRRLVLEPGVTRTGVMPAWVRRLAYLSAFSPGLDERSTMSLLQVIPTMGWTMPRPLLCCLPLACYVGRDGHRPGRSG